MQKQQLKIKDVQTFHSTETKWIGDDGDPLLGFKPIEPNGFWLSPKYDWKIVDGRLVAYLK